jgi:hypothetical protein
MSAARKLRRRVGTPGAGVFILHVRHDANCSHVVTGQCACTPDRVIEPMTPSSLAAADKASRDWQRERLS